MKNFKSAYLAVVNKCFGSRQVLLPGPHLLSRQALPPEVLLSSGRITAGWWIVCMGGGGRHTHLQVLFDAVDTARYLLPLVQQVLDKLKNKVSTVAVAFMYLVISCEYLNDQSLNVVMAKTVFFEVNIDFNWTMPGFPPVPSHSKQG